MPKKKEDQLNYYFGIRYYAMGMVDSNNRPMAHQLIKTKITRGEYQRLKKEIEERDEKMYVHPAGSEAKGLVESYHHHQPFFIVSVWYEGRPKHGIVVPEAQRIITGKVN